MNKKFSTLVAVLLAAGAWTTLEAKVVEVATPAIGNSYLIGTDVDGNAGTVTNLVTGLTGIQTSAVPVTNANAAWLLEETEGGFYLKNVQGEYVCAVNNVQNRITLSSEIEGIKFAFDGNKIVVAEEVSTAITKGMELSVSNTLSLVASGSGTELAFALYGEDSFKGMPGLEDATVVFDANGAINKETLTTDAVIKAPLNIKVGDAYLVVKTDDNGNYVVEELTGDDAIKTLNADNSLAASWEWRNGYLVSTAALRVAEPKMVYLVYENGGYATVSIDMSSSSTIPEKATNFASDKEGIEDAVISISKTSLPADEETGARSWSDIIADASDLKLLTSTTDDYVIVKLGDNFLYADEATGNVEVKFSMDLATDNYKGYLWDVNRSGAGENAYNYTFTSLAENGGKAIAWELNGTTTFVANTASLNGLTLTNNGMPVTDKVTTGVTKAIVALYEAPTIVFTADELNDILKPGFGMTVKIAANNDKAIEGVEVFGKTMYAVAVSGNPRAIQIVDELKDDKKTPADDANYLVLDKAGWDGISANSQLNGEFIWVSAKDLADADLNKNWHSTFEFRYSAGKPDTDVLETLYVPGVGASAYILSVNGINYLTTKKSISGTETWPYIKLAPQNIVDVKTLLGKYWNITFAEKTVSNPNEEYKLNGGVVAVVQREGATTPKADYVKASSVLLTSPEAQWGVVAVSGSTFTLQNRENPDVKIEGVTLRYDEATKLYTIYTNNTTNPELDGDVVKLASHTITGTVHMDGFMDAKPAELRNKVFHIGQYHYETGNSTAFWAENHQANRSHQLGVVTDEEAAVDWRLSIEMQKDRDGLETAKADTMYVITKLAALNNNGGIDNYKAADTLAILQYKFQNKGNLEYVIFNGAANQKYYQCQEDKSVEATALHFALKLKPDSTYNVVSVVEKEGKRADKLGAEKIYVANSQQWGSLKQMPTYGEDNNSLMQVIPVDRPEYRKVEMAWGDTIKLWRNENESEALYEQRNDKAIVADKALSFLNIENVNDPKFDINPALFVDTAYINRWDADGVKNTCYQYLLVVNPKNVSEYYCPLTPEHNTDAWREANGGPCPDAKKSTYVEGRFLVNLIDTANVYGLTHLHNNPYINRTEEGADRAKLSFVDGIHAGDTLYLFRGNGDMIKLNLNTPDFNVAKFAFKYEDVEEGSFKIQTQWKDYLAGEAGYTEAKDFAEAYEDDIYGSIHNNEGYLRWTNGCIVVDHTYQKGDVFNMTERYTEQNPTANEEISAENTAVSVVATEGAVIIKGAEGKNVVIATILGKVVANETVNSDNETIAVPAGIAVVSVDGESFKVVVK